MSRIDSVATRRMEMMRRSRTVVVVLGVILGMVGFSGGAWAQGRTATDVAQPLRVAIAGLVHGHAGGFLSGAVKRTDVEIVGVQEPDRALFDEYAKKFGLDAKLYHSDLDEMITATKPQAVLAYTNTFDHRKVVEVCAKHGVAVMMEKPLAVSA